MHSSPHTKTLQLSSIHPVSLSFPCRSAPRRFRERSVLQPAPTCCRWRRNAALLSQRPFGAATAAAAVLTGAIRGAVGVWRSLRRHWLKAIYIPNAEPTSRSNARKTVSAVCTSSILMDGAKMPASLARTAACGSASDITVAPFVSAILFSRSAMRASKVMDCSAEASSAAKPWYFWQNVRPLLPLTSVHSLVQDQGRWS